jgi:hypothetical protein
MVYWVWFRLRVSIVVDLKKAVLLLPDLLHVPLGVSLLDGPRKEIQNTGEDVRGFAH